MLDHALTAKETLALGTSRDRLSRGVVHATLIREVFHFSSKGSEGWSPESFRGLRLEVRASARTLPPMKALPERPRSTGEVFRARGVLGGCDSAMEALPPAQRSECKP